MQKKKCFYKQSVGIIARLPKKRRTRRRARREQRVGTVKPIWQTRCAGNHVGHARVAVDGAWRARYARAHGRLTNQGAVRVLRAAVTGSIVG